MDNSCLSDSHLSSNTEEYNLRKSSQMFWFSIMEDIYSVQIGSKDENSWNDIPNDNMVGASNA